MVRCENEECAWQDRLAFKEVNILFQIDSLNLPLPIRHLPPQS